MTTWIIQRVRKAPAAQVAASGARIDQGDLGATRNRLRHPRGGKNELAVWLNRKRAALRAFACGDDAVCEDGSSGPVSADSQATPVAATINRGAITVSTRDRLNKTASGTLAVVDVILGAAHRSLFSLIRSGLECPAPVSARKGD